MFSYVILHTKIIRFCSSMYPHYLISSDRSSGFKTHFYEIKVVSLMIAGFQVCAIFQKANVTLARTRGRPPNSDRFHQNRSDESDSVAVHIICSVSRREVRIVFVPQETEIGALKPEVRWHLQSGSKGRILSIRGKNRGQSYS